MKVKMIVVAVALLVFKVNGAVALVTPSMQMQPFANMNVEPMWNQIPPSVFPSAGGMKAFCQRLLDRDCPASTASSSPGSSAAIGQMPFTSTAQFNNMAFPQFMGTQSTQGNYQIQPMRAIPLPVLVQAPPPMWAAPAHPPTPVGSPFGGFAAVPMGRSMTFPTPALNGDMAAKTEPKGDDHGILNVYRSLNGSRPATTEGSKPDTDPTSPVARMEKLGQVVGEIERVLGFDNSANFANNNNMGGNGARKTVSKDEEVTYIFDSGIDDQTLKEMGQIAHAESKSKYKRSVEYGYPSYQGGDQAGFGNYPHYYRHGGNGGPYWSAPSASPHQIPPQANPAYIYSMEGYLRQQLNLAKSTLKTGTPEGAKSSSVDGRASPSADMQMNPNNRGANK